MPGHSPNILFILSDDQGAWALGCAGNDEIRTPNLDRLAQTGMRFSNFFCASPVCSPARASILTGRIPSQHGIHDWLRGGNALTAGELEAGGGGLIEYLKDQPGYTDVLAQAGWVCGLSGKWHLGDSHHPQKGFTYWEAHALGGGPYYNAPVIRDGDLASEPGYITDYITTNALRFLEAQKDDPRPFYLSVNYTAPHSPWEREQHPHDLFDAYFNRCDFHSIPLEPAHPWQINSAPHGYSQESRQPILSGYFSAITAMDRGVGRLLDWLEAQDLRQDTLVLFSSDNGMNMGHHGIFGKGNGTFPANMFDTSVKVPMLVSQPGNVPQGLMDGSLLSHYDLFPTLLEYAGVDIPATLAGQANLPGRSFATLVRGQGALSERPLVIFDEYGPTRMIRTSEWKYIHRYPYGPHELYDLANDPEERINLAGDPDQQPRLRALRAELSDWFVRHSDPARDGAHEPVTGKGQLCMAGTASGGRTTFADDWAYLVPADPAQPRPGELIQKTRNRL